MPPAPDELSSPLDASSDVEPPPSLDVEVPPLLLLPLLPPDEEVVFNPVPLLEPLPPLDEDPLLVEDPVEEVELLFSGVVLGCIWKVGAFDDPHPATTAARHTPKSIT